MISDNTQAQPLDKTAVSSCFCGEVGQIIIIKNNKYYIGDVVLLTNRKTKTSKYYQLIWSDCMFRLMLENKNNALASVHPSDSFWHTRAYIDLYEITENHIPYVDIERIGNSNKDLKLIKRISRVGMKPTK